MVPRGGSANVERSVAPVGAPERSAATSSPSRRRVRKESSPWRRKTIRVDTDDKLGVATLIELHRSVAVGSVCGHAAERRERLCGGMNIPVLISVRALYSSREVRIENVISIL